MTFAKEGDTGAFTRGMDRVLLKVTELSQVYFPVATKYFDALRDLSDGIKDGWAMYESGDVDGALTEIWGAVKVAVDDIVPEEFEHKETYKLVMGSIDGVVGEMSR